MPNLSTRTWRNIIVVFFAVLFFCILLFTPVRIYEADSFFHFALSREIAAKGLIYRLPQFSDLGWAHNFIDKEFLFHQLTAFAYGLANEEGVKYLCLFLSLGVFLLLVKIAEHLGAGLFATPLVFIGSLNIHFLFRLTLIRPHILGLLLALIILLGVLKKNRSLLVIGSFLFPLSYHTLYIPCLILGLPVILRKNEFLKFILTFGFLPMVVGTLINPYFPGTLEMTWLGLKIALNHAQSPLIGTEAKPLSFIAFLDGVGAYVFLVFAIGIVAFRKKVLTYPFSYILSLAAIFLVCMYLSPRAIEYLVPFMILLGAASIPHFNFDQKTSALTVCGLFFLIHCRFFGYTFIGQRQDYTPWQKEILSTIDKLPSQSHGKVFNCEWETGSLILYKRPSYQINEALDPNFLQMQRPELARLKLSLLTHTPSDLYTPLTRFFKADYVLCMNEQMVSKLDGDNRFKVIARGSIRPVPVLYQVEK